MRYALSSIACIAVFSAVAADQPYVWKNNELYRFEYEKSVAILQEDESGKVAPRTSEFAAILILEVKSVVDGKATAILRFDSPRVSLPEYRSFSSQANAPEHNDAKAKALARSIEGAIKTARWSVTLEPSGVVRVDSRVPEKLSDWMKEPANAAGWRRKASDVLTHFVEEDLGLKVGAADHELLFAFAALPAPTAAIGRLHPVRTPATPAQKTDSKTTYGFKRVAPGDAGQPVSVPQLIGNVNVQMTLAGVETETGTATLDKTLGLLDALHEAFTARLTYSLGSESIEQQVKVKYSLKRLAPAIRQE